MQIHSFIQKEMIYTFGITPELTEYVLPRCRNTDSFKSVKADWQQNFH